MKVYQLKIEGLDLLMDPVFKTKEGAELFISKYHHRNFEIINKDLEEQKDYVYRIRETDEEGYTLLNDLFTSLEDASMNITNENQRVVKEPLISEESFTYELVEV